MVNMITIEIPEWAFWIITAWLVVSVVLTIEEILLRRALLRLQRSLRNS